MSDVNGPFHVFRRHRFRAFHSCPETYRWWDVFGVRRELRPLYAEVQYLRQPE